MKRVIVVSLSAFEKNLWIARLAEFENPRKIIFGVNSIEKVGIETKQFGKDKVLIITDEIIEKVGHLERVLTSLGEEGLEAYIHKIPLEEPTMEGACAVTEVVRNDKFEVVIGIGGGSCLDLAKLASAMATNHGEVSEYCARLKGEIKELKNRTLPKIMIPTTAGTGSEAARALVVIDGEYKTWIIDNKLLSEVAIVDPTLTLTMPPRLTASTGMDAFSHATEALMSRLANPISDALAFKAVELISQNLRTAYYQGDDLEARWNMSLAANLAGWVIGFPWIDGPAGLGHCIAEAFGSKYRIPHGISCALTLPYVMEFNLPGCIERMAEIAYTMGEDVYGLSLNDAALQSVHSVLKLMKYVELPTSLKQVKFPQEDIQDLARYIVEERQYLYDLERFNPRKLTLENITQLLSRMWEGIGV